MSYRNLLFVPAIEKFLSNILLLEADGFIIDLEDSIPENQKSESLERTIHFLSKNDIKKDVFIRVNNNNYENEIRQLQVFDIKGYMVPKVENKKIINHISTLLNSNQKLIALIESPIGIINLEQILLEKQISMLAFGAEDYLSRIGVDYTEEILLYPKSKIVTYAHAYNLEVFDSISLNYTETKLLREEVNYSKKMGFTGKLAIHPNQLKTINDVFTVYDKSYYESIIQEYEKSNEGVVLIDGKIYEKPHIEKFKKFLKS